MSEQPENLSRRRFLTLATGAAGGVAALGVGVPFFMSWLPSERAKASGAPTLVDVSKLEPGQQMTTTWRGKPIWVVSRTKEQLDNLKKIETSLVDPDSESPEQPENCKNATRSIKPEFLVAVGICTHLGCSPNYRPEIAPADLGSDWLGGFFCPCHGSKFDLAARVFKGVPAPKNIEIPPYQFLSDSQIQIGE